MAPRLQYYLVFSKDPSAVDVVREDLVKGIQPENIAAGSSTGPDGVKVTFPWTDKDKVVHQVEGVILAQKGLKKNLEALRVSREGEIITGAGEGVGTRKQEIQRELSRQQNARKLQLLERSEEMLEGGPDALVEQLQPTIRKRHHGPLNPLPEERKQALKQMIDDMRCFKQGANKVEVSRGTGIWLPAGPRSIAIGRYRNKPSRLISALIHLAYPEELLREPGIAVTSTRQCVGLPSKILESIYLCAERTFRKAGGDIETQDIDIKQMLRDHITNTRQKHKRLNTSTSTNTSTDTNTPTDTITPNPLTIQTATATLTSTIISHPTTPMTTLANTHSTTTPPHTIPPHATPPHTTQGQPHFSATHDLTKDFTSPDHGYAMQGPSAQPVTSLLSLFDQEEEISLFNQEEETVEIAFTDL